MDHWEKIKSLFQEAVELSPERIEAFLNENCGDDAALREELESLIEAYKRSGDFLEIPPLQSGGINNDKAPSDPFIGIRVGKYSIEQKIGEGGMAIVYSASRVDEQFTRRVAIKLIKRGMDTDEIIRRFKFEQQTLAGLNHPNIAKIFDGGTTESGLPYFVMELVEGERIEKYCSNESLTITERLDLFLKVCSAIQYAHQNLVVHRDIKPGNIFVTKDGTPKLLDFGIAKLLDPSSAQATILTRTGLRFMTLEYASPEQLKGRRITTATDIYSLGVVLYELLTGSYPYKFDNSLPSEIERVVCTTEPEKPSTAVRRLKEKRIEAGREGEFQSEGSLKSEDKNYEKIKKRLTGDIDNIVLKAMQKEPERRYSSVEQFSEDIRRYLVGLPVVARGNSLAYRSRKFFQRHKTSVIASFVILMILLGGSIEIIHQSHIAASERDIAQTEMTKEKKINDFLQNMLSSADPYEQGKDVKVVEVLGNAVKQLNSGLKTQPEIKAELETTIGLTYQNLGVYDKAQSLLKRALEIRQKLHGKDNEETAESIKNLATILDYDGNFQQSAKLYKEAIRILEGFKTPNQAALAEALNDYGTLLIELGSYDSAIVCFRRALFIHKKTFGDKDYDTAAMLNNLGISYDYKNDLPDAKKYYRQALNISTQLPPNNALQAAHIYNNLAEILEETGEFDGALKLFEKSLALRERLVGINDPESAFAMCMMGGELYYLKDYTGALKELDSAYTVWKKKLPSDHPYFGRAYYWYGKIYNAKGMPKKAEVYLLKSLKTYLAKEPDKSSAIAATECELARSYFLQKEYGKALTLLADNYPILKRTLGDRNIETINAGKLLSKVREKV